MTDVYIAGAARTPIGRFLGGLASVPAVELGAIAIRGALKKAGLDAEHVDEAIIGNVLGAGIGQAPARQAAMRADVPETASVMTVNKVCASGLEAIHLAARSIREGESDVVIAGGMESMSGAPYLIQGARQGLRAGNQTMQDAIIQDGLWCAFEQHHMGNSAEAIAEKYGLTRNDLDEYALESHRRATAAWKAGAFDDEVVPVVVGNGRHEATVTQDEGPRSDTSLEALGKLKPAFEPDGIVTAGNAPGLTDGAAALVVVSERASRSMVSRQSRGWSVMRRLALSLSGYLTRPWTPRGSSWSARTPSSMTTICWRSTKRSLRRSWPTDESWIGIGRR